MPGFSSASWMMELHQDEHGAPHCIVVKVRQQLTQIGRGSSILLEGHGQHDIPYSGKFSRILYPRNKHNCTVYNGHECVHS